MLQSWYNPRMKRRSAPLPLLELPSEIVTVHEAADLLEISPAGVRLNVMRGNLRARRIGWQLFLLRADVISFRDRRQMSGPRRSTAKQK